MREALFDLAANYEDKLPENYGNDSQFVGYQHFSDTLMGLVTSKEQTEIGGLTNIPEPKQFSIVIRDVYEPLTGATTVYFSSPIGVRGWLLHQYIQDKVFGIGGVSGPSHQFAGYHVVTPRQPLILADEPELSEFDSIVDSLPVVHRATKQKLVKLKSILDQDDDEPEMDLDSLRSLVRFLANHEDLPVPRMAATNEGRLHIEWRIAPDGMITMQFVSATIVNYMVAFPAKVEITLNDTGSRSEAYNALSQYFENLT